MKRIQKERSCGIIAFRRNGEQLIFLTILQNNGDWSFPKGHLEEGERCEEAAVREFSEETGLGLKHIFPDAKFSFSFQKEYSDYILDKDVVFYLAEAEDGEPRLQEEEISDYAWLEKDQVLRTLPFEGIKQSFLSACAYLLKKL